MGFLLGRSTTGAILSAVHTGVSGTNSTPVDVISGVPHCSLLSPLLFLIYVDWLAVIPLTGGSLSMFANDVLLY